MFRPCRTFTERKSDFFPLTILLVSFLSADPSFPHGPLRTHLPKRDRKYNLTLEALLPQSEQGEPGGLRSSSREGPETCGRCSYQGFVDPVEGMILVVFLEFEKEIGEREFMFPECVRIFRENIIELYHCPHVPTYFAYNFLASSLSVVPLIVARPSVKMVISYGSG